MARTPFIRVLVLLLVAFHIVPIGNLWAQSDRAFVSDDSRPSGSNPVMRGLFSTGAAAAPSTSETRARRAQAAE